MGHFQKVPIHAMAGKRLSLLNMAQSKKREGHDVKGQSKGDDTRKYKEKKLV